MACWMGGSTPRRLSPKGFPREESKGRGERIRGPRPAPSGLAVGQHVKVMQHNRQTSGPLAGAVVLLHSPPSEREP